MAYGSNLPYLMGGVRPQQLAGWVYDPTRLSAPPIAKVASTDPLAAALITQSQPRQTINVGPQTDDLANALLAAGNSGEPIRSPLELAGRLAQVASGTYAKNKVASDARAAELDSSKALVDALAGSGADPYWINVARNANDPKVIQFALGQATKTPAKATPYTDLAKAQSDLNAGLISQDQYQQIAATLGSGTKTTPYTDLAKAKSDLNAGLITQEQYDKVAAGPMTEWRDATPDEIAAMHLPPNTPLQVNTRTGQKAVPSGLAGGIFGGGAVDQDIVTNIADGVASGNIPPDMKSYYKYKVPVTAELQSRGINLSELTTDWNSTQRHFATLNNPQQTRIRQNIDTLQHTFPIIRSLAEEWKAGGYPLLNEATRKAALQGLLGPDANRIATLLGQQVADVTAEVSSVLMGGNAPTDHAMELAAQNLSADWSYPTLTAAIDQLERNIAFRRNAIENVSTAGVADSRYNYQQTDQTLPPPAAQPSPATTPDKVSTASSPTGGPIKITGDEDYAKLPSGAHFIGPDGKERVKP